MGIPQIEISQVSREKEHFKTNFLRAHMEGDLKAIADLCFMHQKQCKVFPEMEIFLKILLISLFRLCH